MPRAPLTVRCPNCGDKAPYAADNPWRPFCSERCRSQDLGAWATERFRIAAPPSADESGTDPLPDPTAPTPEN